ncbi:MAG: hypothetical protein AB1476_00315 [Candidatus Hadarchaeota archaeon]
MEEVRPVVKPAVPRRVSEVVPGEERVKVAGNVVDKQESEFTIDDGSGRLLVVAEDPSLAVAVDVGAKVIVFGVPMGLEGSAELHAEIVQRVDRLNLELYVGALQEMEKLRQEVG